MSWKKQKTKMDSASTRAREEKAQAAGQKEEEASQCCQLPAEFTYLHGDSGTCSHRTTVSPGAAVASWTPWSSPGSSGAPSNAAGG
mmetsp:Transcript_17736/g.41268  ORF Transcript_17736/g.41268 Transcript_17736/m.41268 type:complete len:86 (+) Transcript_17736:114-371(+)